MTGSTWIGLDRGDRDLAAAEHLVADVAPALSGVASVACTHVVTRPFGHFAVGFSQAFDDARDHHEPMRRPALVDGPRHQEHEQCDQVSDEGVQKGTDAPLQGLVQFTDRKLSFDAARFKENCFCVVFISY